MPPSSVTIVGASLAGLRGAEALRRAEYAGPITIIGDEAHLPYDRPPLSKKVLSGVWDLDKPGLVTAERLAELDITIETGVQATGFDLTERVLTTRVLGPSQGSPTTHGSRTVDALLIATGASPRWLPGTQGVVGVHVVRSLDDAAGLRSQLAHESGRVVVVGAGFIGAEVAATARTMGHEVTLVETAERPLQRVLNPELGDVIAAIHTENGVDVRCGVGVDHLATNDHRVTGVVLSDGTALDTTCVVVGIGVVPNTAWLEGSGLTIDNGVVCDSTTLAASGVTAAGDVARWPSARFGGELIRVEQWDNAVAMGPHAALRLLVDDPSDAEIYDPVPWFWSDQYDRKIQLAGRAGPNDDMQVVEGSIDERRFVALLGRNGELTGVFGMNRPRHVMQYKALIDQGATFADATATTF